MMEPTTAAAIFIGIDVAKARLDIAVRPAGDHWTAANEAAGITELVAHLKELQPALIALEAAGGLEIPLAAALVTADLPVAVVNPRRVRDFAKAVDQLAKTDAQAQVLSALLARRYQVVSMLVAEQQRLGTALPTIRPRLEAHIAWLRQELADLDHHLRQTIRSTRSGASMMTSYKVCPASARSSRPRSSRNCRSWEHSTASTSLPWWVSLPSTARAGSCVGAVSSGMGGVASALHSIWRRW